MTTTIARAAAHVERRHELSELVAALPHLTSDPAFVRYIHDRLAEHSRIIDEAVEKFGLRLK